MFKGQFAAAMLIACRHRVNSHTGMMLPSVVSAQAAALCQVQDRFPCAYLKSVLRQIVWQPGLTRHHRGPGPGLGPR